MQSHFGPYRVEKPLSEGGMGTVYVAVHEKLGRTVALKVLKPELAEDASFVERFEREARILARLEHPHAVQVFDTGRDNGLFWLAMEWVEGETLEAVLKRNGPLPWEIAGLALHAVLLALTAAHDAGVVHRDVKLANILVKPNGTVKLADFGVAYDTALGGSTRAGELLGTPYSLTPEQIRGENVTPRSDLYGVGLSLYHAVAGCPPFAASSVASLLDKIARNPPPSFAEKGISLPKDFETLVFRALAKEPHDRFQDGFAFAAELSSLFQCHGVLNDRSEIASYLKAPSLYLQKRQETPLTDKPIRITNHEVRGATEILPGTIPRRHRKANRSAYLLFSVLLLAGVLMFSFRTRKEPVPPIPPVFKTVPLTPPTPVESTTVPVVTSAPVRRLVARPVPRDTIPAIVTDTLAPAVVPAPCEGALSCYSGDWADIYLDNVRIGRSPTKNALSVPCGEHVIKLINNRGKHYFTTIRVASGNPVHVNVDRSEFK